MSEVLCQAIVQFCPPGGTVGPVYADVTVCLHTRLVPSKDSSCGEKVRVTQSQVVWMPAIYISCVISDVDKKEILIPKALDEHLCSCVRPTHKLVFCSVPWS